MNIEQNTAFKLASDARHSRVGNEGILLRQKLAEVMVVNELAIRILELAEKPLTLNDLVTALLAEYEASEEQISADAKNFVESLLTEGVLVPA